MQCRSVCDTSNILVSINEWPIDSHTHGVLVLYVHACPQCVHASVLFTPPLPFTLPTVPDPPESLSVVNYGTSQLRATWLRPNEVFDDENQVRYNVTASTGTGSDVTVQTASREQVITGLQPGTTYTVMVCYIRTYCMLTRL